MKSPAPYRLSPEAPGAEPRGFDSHPAPAAPAEAGALAPLSMAERIYLQRAAEAATPGLWMHVHDGDEDEPHCVVQDPGPGSHIGLRYVAEMTLRANEAPANATYIAEACPATVLRLLAQLAAAEAQATLLRERNVMLSLAQADERWATDALVKEFTEMRQHALTVARLVRALTSHGPTQPVGMIIEAIEAADVLLGGPVELEPHVGISPAPPQPEAREKQGKQEGGARG